MRRLRDLALVSAHPRSGDDFDYDNASLLSPWIRYRLICEPEAIAAVLRQHGEGAAEDLIQEICWRTYWKGWLEMRPSVWSLYRREVNDSFEQLEVDRELRCRTDKALQGRTGIEHFDQWVAALRETGYLRSDARMRFADIWIRMLELPWAIGADFFLRHLLDGDPAVNTLSWRWAASRQARAAQQFATAENAERNTSDILHNSGASKDDLPLGGWPQSSAPRPIAQPEFFDAMQPSALLLSEDDLSAADTLDARIEVVGAFIHTSARSPLPVDVLVRDFVAAAIDDALMRSRTRHAATHERFPEAPSAQLLVDWATAHRCRQIVVPYAPVGPVREWLLAVRMRMADSGIRLIQMRRTWDSRLWPRASAGFAAFKRAVEPMIRELV